MMRYFLIGLFISLPKIHAATISAAQVRLDPLRVISRTDSLISQLANIAVVPVSAYAKEHRPNASEIPKTKNIAVLSASDRREELAAAVLVLDTLSAVHMMGKPRPRWEKNRVADQLGSLIPIIPLAKQLGVEYVPDDPSEKFGETPLLNLAHIMAYDGTQASLDRAHRIHLRLAQVAHSLTQSAFDAEYLFLAHGSRIIHRAALKESLPGGISDVRKIAIDSLSSFKKVVPSAQAKRQPTQEIVAAMQIPTVVTEIASPIRPAPQPITLETVPSNDRDKELKALIAARDRSRSEGNPSVWAEYIQALPGIQSVVMSDLLESKGYRFDIYWAEPMEVKPYGRIVSQEIADTHRILSSWFQRLNIETLRNTQGVGVRLLRDGNYFIYPAEWAKVMGRYGTDHVREEIKSLVTAKQTEALVAFLRSLPCTNEVSLLINGGQTNITIDWSQDLHYGPDSQSEFQTSSIALHNWFMRLEGKGEEYKIIRGHPAYRFRSAKMDTRRFMAPIQTAIVQVAN